MRICRVIGSEMQCDVHFRLRNHFKNGHIQRRSARELREVARPFWSHFKDAFFYYLLLAEERFSSSNNAAIAHKEKLDTRASLVRFSHVG